MEKRFKGVFASSVDPTQLSLMWSSLAKVFIGLVAMFAVSKGADPASATTQVQAILDLVAQAVPTIFTLYHTLEAIWGMVRKLWVFFGTK